MKYVGSKFFIAKYFMPLVLDCRDKNQCYVEPFCGGCNTLEFAKNPRIAGDTHPYLVAMWQALQTGWKPPKFISEDEYSSIKNNVEQYPPELVGYVGFNSWGVSWWGGYRRDKRCSPEKQWSPHYNWVTKQTPKLIGVQFKCGDYRELTIPNNSLIYCDPPYGGVKGYGSAWSTEEFWLWCDKWVDQGHTVFVSEYEAPLSWVKVWARKKLNHYSKNSYVTIECLFTKSKGLNPKRPTFIL